MAVFVLKHRSFIHSFIQLRNQSIALLRRGLLLLRIDNRSLLLLLLLLEELDRAVEHQHSHRQHHEARQLQPRPLRQALSESTPQRPPSLLLRPEVMNRHRRDPHQERPNRLHQVPHQRVGVLHPHALLPFPTSVTRIELRLNTSSTTTDSTFSVSTVMLFLLLSHASPVPTT